MSNNDKKEGSQSGGVAPNADTGNQNTRLNDLMFKALDHGIASVEEGGPLVPFVMTESKLSRFVDELLEVAKANAEKFLENTKDEEVIALAYDGYLTLQDGTKYDAIYVKAFAKKEEKGLLLAQRYRYKGIFKKKLETIGNPALVGYPENPLLKKA